MKKEVIRNEIIKQRNLLTPQEMMEKSSAICKKIMQQTAYQKAVHIFLFASFRNEVNTIFLQEDAFEKRKKVYYPKVMGENMIFFQISSPNDLQKGCMGILEPIGNTHPFEGTDEEVLVIVPGLAFEQTGSRIGYGKGYYDRFLTEYPNFHTIAPAYDLQIVKHLETEEHDKKIDCIITEESIWNCWNVLDKMQ